MAARQDTTLQELALELSVERGPSRLVLALSRDTTVLLPVAMVLELVEVRVTEIRAGVRLEGVLAPQNVPFGFDTQGGVAFRGREHRALGVGDVLWRDSTLYVTTGLLGWVLGVEVTMQWPDLAVRIADAEHLPVVARLARERRRAALLRPAAPLGPVEVLRAPRPIADGAVLDWSSNFANGDPSRNNSLQLGLGVNLLGGSLEVQRSYVVNVGENYRMALGVQVNAVLRDSRWGWTAAWPHREWLRQARIGDIVGTGPRARSLRGVALTNAPFLRPSEFGLEHLVGALRPGWEVELYRGDELIGYSQVDPEGGFTLDVPVAYGPNPLVEVAFGPGGEVVRRLRTFQVPFERLPRGRLEYAVSAGECRADPCEHLAGADLRYGLTGRLTVQAGWDRFWRDTLPDLSHPYGLVSTAVTRAIGLTVEGVARGFARARVAYDPHTDLHVDLGHVSFDTSVVSPLIGSKSIRRQWDGSLFWRPAPLGGGTFTQVTVARSTGAGRTRQQVQIGATTRLGALRLSLTGRDERDRLEGLGVTRLAFVAATADAIVVRGPRSLRGTFLRAGWSGDCDGGLLSCMPRMARVTAGIGRQLVGPLRMDLGVVRERGRRGVQVDLGLATLLPGLRAASRSSFTPELGHTGTQILEGSVLWDRRTRRLAAGSGRNLGRAGFGGVVFLDEDGDGVRDRDEPGLPEVLVRVGSGVIATDSLGQFAVWDLVPFEAAVIEVDSLSLPNPLWTPAVGVARLSPAPNSFRFVEVPILQGAEVSGRVVFGDAETPLAGARLMFRNLATGAVRDVTTFTDGSFLLLGLRAGEYEVAPAPGLLDQLAARSEPVRVDVRRGSGANRVEGIVVRVERRP